MPSLPLLTAPLRRFETRARAPHFTPLAPAVPTQLVVEFDVDWTAV